MLLTCVPPHNASLVTSIQFAPFPRESLRLRKSSVISIERLSSSSCRFNFPGSGRDHTRHLTGGPRSSASGHAYPHHFFLRNRLHLKSHLMRSLSFITTGPKACGHNSRHETKSTADGKASLLRPSQAAVLHRSVVQSTYAHDARRAFRRHLELPWH